jgi:hypothetical protein
MVPMAEASTARSSPSSETENAARHFYPLDLGEQSEVTQHLSNVIPL